MARRRSTSTRETATRWPGRRARSVRLSRWRGRLWLRWYETHRVYCRYGPRGVLGRTVERTRSYRRALSPMGAGQASLEFSLPLPPHRR